MSATHSYDIDLVWQDERGLGTESYRSYERNFRIDGDGKTAPILGSSDPAFLGDATRWNPEEMLLGSIAACHKLWYLHLCADNGVVVRAYRDHAVATMGPDEHGKIRFLSATLRPMVEVEELDQIGLAKTLHAQAREACFIANSLNFPIAHEPTITVA